MRAPLFLLTLLLSPLVCLGANPTLTNFNARHFIVQPFTNPTNVIILRLDPRQFDTNATSITLTNVGSSGGTNYFQTIIVTNTYTSNLFVTNLYVTNINGSPYDPMWTNELGNYRPTQLQSLLTATGITSHVKLETKGAFIMSKSGQQTLLAGAPGFTNNLGPADLGFLVLSSDADTTNALDRLVNLNAGNGQGQFLLIENRAILPVTQSAFSMLSGTPLWDGSGYLILVNGDWLPTKTGETILLHNDGYDWREITRFYGAGGGVPINPQPFMSVMNLGGNPPPLDGSVPTVAVWDQDAEFLWINPGASNNPTWFAH